MYPTLMLLVDTVLYLLLALYFDAVIPGEYGQHRPPYFIFTPSFWKSICSKKEKVMFDQMYDAFHWRLSPNLSGYLKGHSFDSVCHPLLLAKLKAYGFTDDALELMSAYLLGKRQRVKLDGVYSLCGEL